MRTLGKDIIQRKLTLKVLFQIQVLYNSKLQLMKLFFFLNILFLLFTNCTFLKYKRGEIELITTYWIGGTDQESEGLWTTWNTLERIQV